MFVNLLQAYKLCARPTLAASDPTVTALAPVQQISIYLEALEGGARISWARASHTPGGRHAGALPAFASPLSDALALAVSNAGLASLPASVLRVVARCAARYRKHSLFATIAAHVARDKFSGWTKEAVAELELLECMLELQVFGSQDAEADGDGDSVEHKEGDSVDGTAGRDGVFDGGKDGDGEDVDGDGVVTSEEMLEANQPRALENGRAFPAKELRRLAGALRRAEAFPDLLERSAELVGFIVQVGIVTVFRALYRFPPSDLRVCVLLVISIVLTSTVLQELWCWIQQLLPWLDQRLGTVPAWVLLCCSTVLSAVHIVGSSVSLRQ